jgi:hypothetical protein
VSGYQASIDTCINLNQSASAKQAKMQMQLE